MHVPIITRWSGLAALARGGGVRTSYLVTKADGASQFLSGITEFESLASLAFHSHNCEESVVVLEGRAVFETDGETFELSPYDTTLVPEGVVHRFFNPAHEPLKILWVYGSADATRTLAETGETVPVDREGERR